MVKIEILCSSCLENIDVGMYYYAFSFGKFKKTKDSQKTVILQDLSYICNNCFNSRFAGAKK